MAQNKLKWAPTTNAFQTTLNGAINSTATTITLNSVTGLQNKAGILVIDRVDSAGTATPSAREYIYFTGVSGSSVTLPSAADGRGQGGSTAQSHADGAVVEAIMDVDAWNGLVDSYDVQHNDAGTHNALTTDTFSASSLVSLSSNLFTNTLNVSSVASINGELSIGRFRGASGSSIYQTAIVNQLIVPIGVSGASVSGALANDTVQGNLLIGNASGSNYMGYGAWQSWTPTFTNFTKGSASVTAKYIQIGKKVTFNLKVTLSSSTMGTQPQFTLPVTAASTHGVHDIIGTGDLKDNTGNSHPTFVYMDNTTTCELINFSVSGTQVYFSQVTATAPFTWADSDFFQVTGTYEAA